MSRQLSELLVVCMTLAPVKIDAKLVGRARNIPRYPAMCVRATRVVSLGHRLTESDTELRRERTIMIGKRFNYDVRARSLNVWT
jgi:hypothetical protein